MVIYYRACPLMSVDKKRPYKTKLELTARCFESLLVAFDSKGVKITVLLDKPMQEFKNIFSGYPVIESDFGSMSRGNTMSFHRQMKFATENDDPYYFFVEDDYFFQPYAGEVILGSVDKFDFFSPYDHPGYYTEDEHVLRERKVIIAGNWHWQSSLSTTLTFGGKRDVLKEEIGTMQTYQWADHPMWKDLTQRRELWTPMPSLATHMETEFISPVSFWDFPKSLVD